MLEDQLQSILHQYWGFDHFRPMQREAVEAALSGRDCFVLMPTGGGKSLCYQVPALAQEGCCLVVSPLVALMRDQVAQLRRRRINAACLSSDMTYREQEVVLNGSTFGDTKLLYVSPERLRNEVFVAHLRQMRLSLIAVDEAHCISQWGHDFRPSYLQIATLRALFPDVPMMALTATATPAVADDIVRQLQLRDGYARLQSSFARKNIQFLVFHPADKRKKLLAVVRGVRGSGLVYVASRRHAEQLASWLAEQGVGALAYHAGMPNAVRDKVQLLWMQGRTPLLVATSAFGMGIDKSDVRYVVHYDMPTDLESYYQEAGRAGRDGKRAYAVLLCGEGDDEALRRQVEQEFPEPDFVRNVYRGICNFVQVPVGSGQGTRHDFDLLQICHTYGFPVLPFAAALRSLEHEGAIRVDMSGARTSRLHVEVDREELYRFQVENSRYDSLLTALGRLYGGLFTQYVTIDERAIAQRLEGTERVVREQLQTLHERRILTYLPRTDKPQLFFVQPRLDAALIGMPTAEHNAVKQQAHERMEAMLRYAGEKQVCRVRQLLHYFGETADDCGQCDVCLRRAAPSATP